MLTLIDCMSPKVRKRDPLIFPYSFTPVKTVETGSKKRIEVVSTAFLRNYCAARCYVRCHALCHTCCYTVTMLVVLRVAATAPSEIRYESCTCTPAVRTDYETTLSEIILHLNGELQCHVMKCMSIVDIAF